MVLFESLLEIFSFHPFQLHFWLFFDPCDALEPRNYLRSTCFVIFFLAIHLYYILGKLEHFIGIIWIIIGDFCFSPLSALFLDLFWPLRCSRIKKLLKFLLCNIFVSHPLILHIGEVGAPQCLYLHHYWPKNK